MSIIRQRKKRIKKSRILIVVILLASIIGIMLIFLYQKILLNQIVVDNPVIKKETNDNFNKLVKSDVLTSRTGITDDLRLQFYKNIILSNKLAIGDYVDVRIAYANGLDFIILPKKRIVDLSILTVESNIDNAIWFEVSEEEIMRMSSAFVDSHLYEGSVIYAIEYVNVTQKAAIANYPVNEDVKKLIDSDPNIINKGINLLESSHRNLLGKSNDIDSVIEDEAFIEGEQSDASKDINIMQEDIVYID